MVTKSDNTADSFVSIRSDYSLKDTSDGLSSVDNFLLEYST